MFYLIFISIFAILLNIKCMIEIPEFNYDITISDTLKPYFKTNTLALYKSDKEKFNQSLNKYLSIHPEDNEYKSFIIDWAKKESNFRNIQNLAGHPAYGYFQFWKPDNPESFLSNVDLQIKKAFEYAKDSAKHYDKKWAKNNPMYSKEQYMMGTVLGGKGGADKVMLGLGNPSDGYATVKDYMQWKNS